MYLAILIIGIFATIFAIILSLSLWSLSYNKRNNQNDSNLILSKFEFGDNTPTLTEMIEFHRNNDTVEYEIK